MGTVQVFTEKTGVSFGVLFALAGLIATPAIWIIISITSLKSESLAHQSAIAGLEKKQEKKDEALQELLKNQIRMESKVDLLLKERN